MFFLNQFYSKFSYHIIVTQESVLNVENYKTGLFINPVDVITRSALKRLVSVVRFHPWPPSKLA